MSEGVYTAGIAHNIADMKEIFARMSRNIARLTEIAEKEEKEKTSDMDLIPPLPDYCFILFNESGKPAEVILDKSAIPEGKNYLEVPFSI